MKTDEQFYVINASNEIVAKFRLKGTASSELSNLKDIYGYECKIVTKEEFEEANKDCNSQKNTNI